MGGSRIIRCAARLVAVVACVIPTWVSAATITVNTTAFDNSGDGFCDIREALTAANTDTATDACPAGSGTDTIVFSVAGVINVNATTSKHLRIQAPVTIDGTTAPGYAAYNDGGTAFDPMDDTFPVPTVVLNRTGGANPGIRFDDGSASISAVRGLEIRGFTASGVVFESASDELEECVLHNISDHAIAIQQLGTNNLLIQHNVIGLDSGLNLSPNTLDGIKGNDVNSGHQIIENLIAGNDGDGIEIYNGADVFDDDITIRGNLIGARPGDTTCAVGNGRRGIYLTDGARDNTVQDNVVGCSGRVVGAGSNNGVGIDMPGQFNSINNDFVNNYVGTNSRGDNLGNLHAGFNISGGTNLSTISGNVIAFNGLGASTNNNSGILVQGLSETNTITQNDIYGNANLGIDLWAVTAGAPDAIDPGDGDGNANQGQNYPTLTPGSATIVGDTKLSVTGTLDTPVAFGPFTVEFFCNGAADASGFGEGEDYIGSTTVAGGAPGAINVVDLNVNVSIASCNFLSSTATDAAGNTSEFSGSIAATAVACVDDTAGGIDSGCSAVTPACDDSTPGSEVCVACTAAADCDDSVACTVDACDGLTNTCSNTANDASCSDGLFCNGAETCHLTMGCQAGSAPSVDDGVACTDDSCDEVGDTIVNTPNDGNCDDGLFCNGSETCHATMDCQAGSAPSVDDGVACTDDSCDEVGDTIVNTPNDGNCDDGLFCNGSETCHATMDCQAGSAPSVDDGVACTDDSCDEVGDTIVNTPNDGNCDDGLFCNGSETCHATMDCQAGSAPSVDDGVACTDDSCDEVGDTIVNTPNDGNCDDGLFCNGSETCHATMDCQAGSAPSVDDGVACTDDSCDEVGDMVVNTPNDGNCDDGLFCNGAETCHATMDCQAGSAPSVDDGVACTDDSCDEVGDMVVNTPNDGNCDDGLFCNGSETCHATLDCQAGSAPSVDDGVACTDDSCDEVGDTIVNTPNDGNCDDGLFCNGSETCHATMDCQAGTPPVVNDDVACTDDSCDEVGDVVVNTPNDGNCDDGLFCNGSETCHATLDCQAGSAPSVDDGVACTDDSCDEVGDTIVNTPNDGNCDDGLFCNGSETCHATMDCQAGSAPSVDDGVACTDDSCDEVGDMVVNTPNDGNCGDGLTCNGVETCHATLDCQAGVDEVAGVMCSESGGSVCDGGGMCVECVDDGDCSAGSVCESNACVDDSDRDGIADRFDADDDNDGIVDFDESGVAEPSADTDSDGTPDWNDSDTLGFVDTNSDDVDDRMDMDRDGVPNHLDLDADNDGLPDLWENGERALDLNLDGQLTPTGDPGSFPSAMIADADVDRDGLLVFFDADDMDDADTSTLNPVIDTDGTGSIDALDLDADDDGICDIIEANNNADLISDMIDMDDDCMVDAFDDSTNNNGYHDANESSPWPWTDTDGDITPDFLDLDSDEDSVLDAVEGHDADWDLVADVAPSPGLDADADGLQDAYDAYDHVMQLAMAGTVAPIPNFDGDVAPDWRDQDDDGDGVCGPGGEDMNADQDCEDVGEDTLAVDCDDLDTARSSLIAEICNDGIDNDCDGMVDEDDCNVSFKIAGVSGGSLGCAVAQHSDDKRILLMLLLALLGLYGRRRRALEQDL